MGSDERREASQLDRIETLLHRVLLGLAVVNLKENLTMADLSALTADVANTTSVEQSAITLIEGLAAQIAAAANDPAALAALGDQLNTEAASLAAAVAQNTPTPPPAPPA
jgi:hypothetical protein